MELHKWFTVGGLGGKNPRDRNGFFEYYISEPIGDNDAKAVGPFVMAGIELQMIFDKK